MVDCDALHTTAAPTIRKTIALSNLLLDFVTYNICKLDVIAEHLSICWLRLTYLGYISSSQLERGLFFSLQ
jgi:hypothetical protein